MGVSQLAAKRTICRRIRRVTALGRCPVRALLDDDGACPGFGRGMPVRLRDHALPGKGQQRREEDKPPSSRICAGQILPSSAAHYRALSMNRPTIRQSRAFWLRFRTAARILGA
jgi:hypothetical protein